MVKPIKDPLAAAKRLTTEVVVERCTKTELPEMEKKKKMKMTNNLSKIVQFLMMTLMITMPKKKVNPLKMGLAWLTFLTKQLRSRLAFLMKQLEPKQIRKNRRCTMMSPMIGQVRHLPQVKMNLSQGQTKKQFGTGIFEAQGLEFFGDLNSGLMSRSQAGCVVLDSRYRSLTINVTGYFEVQRSNMGVVQIQYDYCLDVGFHIKLGCCIVKVTCSCGVRCLCG